MVIFSLLRAEGYLLTCESLNISSVFYKIFAALLTVESEDAKNMFSLVDLESIWSGHGLL